MAEINPLAGIGWRPRTERAVFYIQISNGLSNQGILKGDVSLYH
jgi:hypothetical protein